MKMMFRKFIFLVGIVVCLLLTTVPASAVGRWSRMGDGSVVFLLERACQDGFTLTAAIFKDTYRVGDTREAGPVEIRFTDRRASVFMPSDSTAFLTFPNIPEPEWRNIWLGYPFAAPTINIIATVRDLNDRIGPDNSPLHGTVNVRWTGSFKPQYKYVAMVWSVGSLQLSGWVKLPTELEDCHLFGSGALPFDPGDDRLNRDPGASAAVYCEDDAVKVYGINNESQGFLSFTYPVPEVIRLGRPAENMLLASGRSAFGGAIRLYLLTTGELQINAPGLPPEPEKEYVFIWSACPGTA